MTDGLGTITAALDTGGLWAAAERLRAARRAHDQFLGRWAADRLLDAVADAWAEASDNTGGGAILTPRWSGRVGLDD